ncbi:MAG: universal stress protein [Mycolicibacterium sp.]|uniref:universal stress protein n=1 Tax=Mycolicibacterium sp. TaxID=2320850 RepID=UPI003D121842
MAQESAHSGIVVGVDGSPESNAAVAWAARAAAMRGARLTLIHALTDPSAAAWLDVPVPADYWPPDYWGVQRAKAADLLADATRIASQALPDPSTITVEQELTAGGAVAPLVEWSKAAEMVVVGCRGRGGLQKILLGSVSSGLVHRAHCPVAVIHDEAALKDRSADAPVVVGIDGSPASEHAVEVAFGEASRRELELVALHTWLESSDDFIGAGWPNVQARADEILAERLAGWQERYPDVVVRRVVKMDNPIHQLLELSKSAQLLVVGSHGRGGIAGLILGSVSSAVVQRVQIPVIVARRP